MQRYNLIKRNIFALRTVQNSNISTENLTYSTNYYEALGISKNSTQGEIKAAYYRLSMLYHPDKNQGSENAAIKFREITQAYEVLGNFRLRRLYDKGKIFTQIYIIYLQKPLRICKHNHNVNFVLRCYTYCRFKICSES